MPMSVEHKQALAQGRLQSRAIRAYLTALQDRKPGRPVTRQSLERRIEALGVKIAASDDPLRRLDLIQSKLDAEGQLGKLGDGVDFENLEAEFIAHAKAYSERKGINYPAWREMGVPAATLRSAGIAETRRR